ncbi:protein KRI1 homolog [Phoenix dactylifera]|uniref:Protein KRI1 homolog n=1 Tax=Phoenix dactylifera TaxID=42345 RepID=A0A8B7BWC1_PHODC|nr:protein KRI1 homolog [Phoenix dactylifera]
MGIDLFDSCDPGTEDVDLSKIEVDKQYARRLEHNKKREALQRYEELKKRGLAGNSDDSDEDESSSDDGNDDPVDSGKRDLQFFDALVRVRKKDPSILQKDAKIYSDDEEEGEEKPKAAKKERPLYLKDVMAQHLIEEGPEFGGKPLKNNPKVYNKEQEEGLKAFLEAAEKEEDEAGSEDDGDIIKEKEAVVEEVDEDADERNKKLDDYFGKDDELNEDDLFLKNYFLQRPWATQDKDNKRPFDDIDVSEDEDELDKQDRYEAEYNFRHEEGEADRVLGHSRFIEGSVRKKTSSRKLQRKSKEERMALAEFERKEELKHLKNLKKKEIQEKLEKIRAIAGVGEDGVCKLDEDDLEEDFNPEEYDKKMKEMFDADYYDAEDADPGFGSNDEADLEKPDFDKEDELLGLPKGWDVGGSNEGFEAVRERVLKQKEEEEPQKEEGKRKRKRKISLKEKVGLDKELEEYYKLDYEDTIGDLKTRFKYKSVPANRYGLQPEELLVANDKDLNQYVSLKRLAPYREKEWKVTYHQKLKKDLILHGGKTDAHKNGKKQRTEGGPRSTEPEKEKQKTEPEEANGEPNPLSRRSRRRRRQAELKLSHSRLMAYGKVPSKPRKKH